MRCFADNAFGDSDVSVIDGRWQTDDVYPNEVDGLLSEYDEWSDI